MKSGPDKSSEGHFPVREDPCSVRTFSAGVAHEIRNPLAAIQSLVELLAQKSKDPQQQELAGAIVKEVKRLNHLLAEFLQYGRNPPLKYEPTDIDTLIKNVLTFTILPKKNPKLIICTNISKGLARVKIDPEAYHRVLVNAILNAIQAMRGEGRLEIRARICRQYFVIEIKDSGPGIPPENLENIFSPFFTTKRSGSGLGLAISQQIIQQHGGRLYFENNGDAQGVTLVIETPLS